MLLCLGLDYKQRRLRRSRDRGVHRSAAARSARTATRWRTSRSSTRTSTSGTRPTRRGRSSRRCGAPTAGHAAPQRILAFLENEFGQDGAEARRLPAKRRAASRRRSSCDPRNTPAYLSLGDVRFQRGGRRAARSRRGSDWSTRRPSAPTSRSRGSKRPMRAPATPDRFPALCRRLIAANPQDWRARLALARHLASHGDRRTRRSSCCSRRWSTIRTRSRCTRRSGRRSRRSTCPPPLVGRYVELTRDVDLLSRSARLRALPLPQHRAALAVPALPRMEHVRRGADRAGEGRRRAELASTSVRRSD